LQPTDSTKTSTNYTIRAATDADLPAVMALLRVFVEQRKLLRRTRAETAALLGTGFVAELNGEMVGFASVEIYSKKLAEIQCLAVMDTHQGHGLGSELVRHCLELARQRGVMEVMAISSSDKFLQNLGFDYSLPDQKRALFYQLRTREDLYREREAEDE
jgi:amino-acid N-acetyltransferase